jgi:hypothetical protein
MNWKFWKKDDFALPEMQSIRHDPFKPEAAGGLDLASHFDPSNASAPPPPAPLGQPSSFASMSPGFAGSYSPAYAAPPAEPPHSDVSKDLEVIAAKLDTIRAQLEMLNTRVANIEHQQNQANQTQPKRPWY